MSATPNGARPAPVLLPTTVIGSYSVPEWLGQSKVDRSAAYAARHVAKNVVAAGLADRAELQVAYAIGMARPLSLHIETFGTERIARPEILELDRRNFDLRPAALRERLDLLRPIYRATAACGHFGRTEETFTWERTDMADRLREPAGLTPDP